MCFCVYGLPSLFCCVEDARKMAKNGILWRVSPVAKLRVRTIDQLDEACTNADDRMMRFSWASSVGRLISSRQQQCVRQTLACTMFVQDSRQFAIVSMARKFLHRCIGARARGHVHFCKECGMHSNRCFWAPCTCRCVCQTGVLTSAYTFAYTLAAGRAHALMYA